MANNIEIPQPVYLPILLRYSNNHLHYYYQLYQYMKHLYVNINKFKDSYLNQIVLNKSCGHYDGCEYCNYSCHWGKEMINFFIWLENYCNFKISFRSFNRFSFQFDDIIRTIFKDSNKYIVLCHDCKIFFS